MSKSEKIDETKQSVNNVYVSVVINGKRLLVKMPGPIYAMGFIPFTTFQETVPEAVDFNDFFLDLKDNKDE